MASFDLKQPVVAEAATLLSKPLVQLSLCFFLVACVYGFLFAHNYSLGAIKISEAPTLHNEPSSLFTYLSFAWNCFFKPHTGPRSRNQQDALESFYKAQASIYDATRSRLLRGREDMLGLVAAQMKNRIKSGLLQPRPVWIDVSTPLGVGASSFL